MWEIMLILAVALIVIGPKKLPELAKTLGRALGEFKRSAQDFKTSIDMETTLGDLDDNPPPSTDLKEAVKKANEAAAATDEKDDAQTEENVEPQPDPPSEDATFSDTDPEISPEDSQTNAKDPS